jgi:hypothetical protein
VKILTYWVADCLNDHRIYSVRARTRAECRAQVLITHGRYAPPRKVTVRYVDPFDLAVTMMTGGGE